LRFEKLNIFTILIGMVLLYINCSNNLYIKVWFMHSSYNPYITIREIEDECTAENASIPRFETWTAYE